MTQEKAQELINAWYERYPSVRDYVNDMKRLVSEAPHWIENAYGRRRRFYFAGGRGGGPGEGQGGGV